MFKQVRFKNYKALRDVTVDLERFTVFVGPNGSGKTSILEAIAYLSQLAAGQDVGDHANFFEPRYWKGAIGPVTLEAHADLYGVRFQYSSPLWATEGPEQESRKEVKDFSVSLPPRTNDWLRFRSASSDYQKHVAELFGSASLLRLNPTQIAAPSLTEGAHPVVGIDGTGTAWALAHLKLNDEERFRELVEQLRQIVPSARDLRFEQVAITRSEVQMIGVGDKQVPFNMPRQYWGHAIFFHSQSGWNIPASMMSEGTLLALGILAALSRIPKHGVVLLDDLDRALHPKAQAEVVTVLRAILQQREDLQILATSHSPYLLDSFESKEVRLSVLNEEGGAVVAPLASHPESDRWKDVMKAGEFWSSVGESWVAPRVAGETPK